MGTVFATIHPGTVPIRIRLCNSDLACCWCDKKCPVRKMLWFVQCSLMGTLQWIPLHKECYTALQTDRKNGKLEIVFDIGKLLRGRSMWERKAKP